MPVAVRLSWPQRISLLALIVALLVAAAVGRNGRGPEGADTTPEALATDRGESHDTADQ